MKLGRVAIVGAGPAGLFTALLLRQRGIAQEVTVYEKREESDRTGLGIIIHSDMLAAIRAVDIGLEAAIRRLSVRVPYVAARQRGALHQLSQTDLCSVSRSEFIAVLAEYGRAAGVNIAFESTIRDLSALPPSDLVIVANGLHSALRDESLFQPAWREHATCYRWLQVAKRLDGFIFDFAATPGGTAILHAYPFCDDRSSVIIELDRQGIARLEACRSPEQILPLLSTCFEQTLGGLPLQSPLTNGPGDWIQFRTMLCEYWYALDVPTPIVLVGDAARTAHFSIGSGTRLALGDAVELTDQLASGSNLADCLHAYQLARRAASIRLQQKANASSDWFARIDEHLALPPDAFGQALLGRSKADISPLPA